MTRILAILTLMLTGCVPFRVTYGDTEVLPIVHPSSDHNRWYFTASTEAHGDHLFFFDTGYSVTTCDDDFAHMLALNEHGSVQVRGEVGTIEATYGTLPPLTIGGHTIDGLTCLIRDLKSTSSIRDPKEVPVAGVIGADVLTAFFVVLDPESMTLTLTDPALAPKLTRDIPGVLRLRHDSLGGTRRLMPLTINGKRIHPIVDTGASQTHIDGYDLGLLPFDVRKGATIRGSGGDAAEVRDIPLFRTDLNISVFPLSDVQLTGRNKRANDDGLLGINVLKEFRQEYDWKRGWVRLTPVHAAKVPSWRSWKAQTEDASAVSQ